MSHFTQIKTQFLDRECLIDALVATGLRRDQIEVSEQPQFLQDYHGSRTSYRHKDTGDARFVHGDQAHVIVRRQHLGSSNNDFGIYIDPKANESIAFLCDFSRRNTPWNDAWLDRVKQAYAVSKTKKHYKSLGKQVHEVREGNKVHLYVGA